MKKAVRKAIIAGNWKMNKTRPEAKKLEIIKFVISSCHGKPLELILPDLMAASSRLSEQGLSFTNEEISMIIDGLKESMSPEEQQRIDMIRPLIM